MKIFPQLLFSLVAIVLDIHLLVYGTMQGLNCSILLNPSKASEKLSDPTFTRCKTRALLLGYKQFRICNLFAFRSTNPKLLQEIPEIKGTHNDKILRKSILWADSIIFSGAGLPTTIS